MLILLQKIHMINIFLPINFYDQSISDSIKQYDEVRKISTVQGDDYSTSFLLDFACFMKKYRLIAVD